MFRQLDYQDRVLNAIDTYIDQLKIAKADADKVAALAADNPDIDLPIPDFVRKTWETLQSQGRLPSSRAQIGYSERHDGCGRPVPDIVLKVPTGGGKTWLAVSGVSRVMGRYLNSNMGFVLWVVPSETIYAQTLRHLKNRQHPYRQALDRAAAGRVRILEKTDRLDARDVETHLCVMLLMLQSANKQTKDTLKMFRDRGDVHGFFPSEGEQQAHKAALDRTPNLDAYDDMYPMVKDSLGNALRIIRPVVVLDEGHRAISDLAFETLYGFNPCFVLELTATPQDVKPRAGQNPHPGRTANVLVEVTGRELDREGMIKMPLNLDPRQGDDWRATLNAGIAKLGQIDAAAEKFRAECGRYIRPIMVVQVERTGADQRESGWIHAEDVRDMLLTAGFDAAEIAIKTAERNDLGQPENQNLLSPTNRVRAIITKQALQEGWDCPFAYVLCSLAASSNLKAMTQLVGRILRQPDAMKTGVDALDECHVITHHADTARVVEAIRTGLEQDGLGDLVLQIDQDGADGSGKGPRKVRRRPSMKSADIYLPKVMLVEGDVVRDLDYETDVLARIDWRGFDPADIALRIPENVRAAENQLQRIRLADGGEDLFVGELVSGSSESLKFDPAHAVRMILDIVPNPFVGRDIVARLMTTLEARGFDDQKLGECASLILEELRKGLDAERTARAEALFRDEVVAGRIQFRLRLDGDNWKMPDAIESTEAESSRQLVGRNGGPLEKSLFAPIYENEMNADELEVAVYLDGAAALLWWHRNVARVQYSIQGWKKPRIYPDFIFAVQREGTGRRVTILETKGDHLEGNPDTEYKRAVLTFLSENFQWDTAVPAGELQLVTNTGETVDATLILMSDWKTSLPDYL